jgi:type III secretory pathway component EscU
MFPMLDWIGFKLAFLVICFPYYVLGLISVLVNFHACDNYCIYFIVTLIISLGIHGAWVQCKHLYHILQNIMYYGQFEEFIHYPTWNWDEVQRLLARAKTFDNQ